MRKVSKLVILSIFFVIAVNQLFAQDNQSFVMDGSYNGLQWTDFKNRCVASYDLNFIIIPDSIPDIIFSINNDSSDLFYVLKENLTEYGYYISGWKNYVFITKGKQIDSKLPYGFFEGANSGKKEGDFGKKTVSSTGTIITSNSYIKKTIRIGNSNGNRSDVKALLSGYVTNSASGDPIIGGTIYVEELGIGTATNEYGYYELKLKPGNYSLVFNSLESISRTVSIELLGTGTLPITLDQNLFELQEVEISSSKTHNVKGVQLGYNSISGKQVKQIPVVLGEQDVLKVAMLLPGVTSVGEGTSGFNVRGSPSDQNLFYLSKIPIYNTSHLFGFFSAFNADAIDDFKLYKGSIPVKFGGRLSSVFDIKTKQGNFKKFSARGGISPITARLMVEGPIIKDKVSYIAGFRSTYSDWVLKLVNDPEVRNSKAYFGDVILGIDAIINERNSVKITGYGSYDDISLSNNTLYNFNNTGASLNWYHSFGSLGEMKLSFVHSDYKFSESNIEVEFASYTRDYNLVSNNIEIDFNFYLSEKHTLNAGFSSMLYELNRGTYAPYNNNSIITPINFGKEKAVESALYIGDEWKINPLLTLSGGVRINFYNYLGPNSVFNYLDNSPKTPQYISDTLNFNNNEIIKSYNNLDFRLSAVYLLNPDLSIKASYNRLHQYIFLLSNTIAVSPSDTWKLADYNIKPMRGDQFTAGIYSNIGKNFEFSVEAYYKIVENLVEYKDGADILTSKYIEQDVLQGDLNAMGVEFMLKKPFGKLSGWLNYSYSKSSVLVNNSTTGENINFGMSYPSSYDRPHTFNLVANFNATRRLALSGNVSYATGRPITYPTAIYYLDGKKILHYSLRNEYRVPDYFRIDMAVKLEGNLLSRKLAHSQFIFSVYNVTGRKNAYSVYFKAEDGKIKGYKMSVFGTQIYSLTWDFKLGNYND